MARACRNNQDIARCSEKRNLSADPGVSPETFSKIIDALLRLLAKEGPEDGLYHIQQRLTSPPLVGLILIMTPDCLEWMDQKFPDGIRIRKKKKT